MKQNKHNKRKLSFYPLQFEETVATILKVKPKEKKANKRQPSTPKTKTS